MTQTIALPLSAPGYPPHIHTSPPSSGVPSRKGSYLYRKGSIYYFRYVLPARLKTRFSKTEVRLSLRTAYIREARERAARIYSLFTASVEGMPMLSYAEIKFRLNRLLALMVEEQGRQTEPFVQDLGPEGFGALTVNRHGILTRHVHPKMTRRTCTVLPLTRKAMKYGRPAKTSSLVPGTLPGRALSGLNERL